MNKHNFEILFLTKWSKTPSLLSIYSGIGQAFRLKGDFEKAQYYLDEALARSPENEEFLIQRSNIFVDTTRYQEAIQDLTVALSKKKNDPQVFYKRGLAYYQNQEYVKAIKDLNSAFENNPYPSYVADIYYHLGISYANL